MISINDNSKKINDELYKRIKVALEMCGLTAEGYAKLNTTQQHAVDTGNLRNSISHKTDEKTVQCMLAPMSNMLHMSSMDGAEALP